MSYPAIIANFNVHCLGIKAKRNEVVIGDLVTMSLSPYGTRTPSLQSQASCHQDEDAGLVTQKKVHGDTGQFLFCLERQITTWGSVCTKSLSSRISTLNSQKKVWYSIWTIIFFLFLRQLWIKSYKILRMCECGCMLPRELSRWRM